MAKWRIYYDGGLTFSDTDGSIYEAPSEGVQFIAVEDLEHGRVLLEAMDFYWWSSEHGEWLGGDVFGLHDYLRRGLPETRVLFGRMIPTRDYRALKMRVLDDPYLPRKSARAPIERKA